jgi:hypothetical protein
MDNIWNGLKQANKVIAEMEIARTKACPWCKTQNASVSLPCSLQETQANVPSSVNTRAELNIAFARRSHRMKTMIILGSCQLIAI